MLRINIETQKCIVFLVKHREEHVAEYAQQIEGWKLKMQEYNAKIAEWAEGGGEGERPLQPHQPKDFTKDYDWHIGFLKCHVDGTILLYEDDYNKIILNDWNWRGTFATNSSLYSNSNH